MEHEQFDAFTRTWSIDSSRRQALRALLGGVFGSLAVKLGLDDEAEAKRKKHEKRRDNHKRQGQVQATGQKHKKHKKKDKDKPRKPEPCGAEQLRCPDGTCIATDQCCPGERMCPDERCTKSCCVGENQCDDGACLPGGQCCPEERRCPDGLCVRRDLCCPGKKLCGIGCIDETDCCHHDPSPLCTGCEDVVCDNGNWECQSICELQESICCDGECLLPCSDGKVVNPQTCQCECPDGQWECPGGSCAPVEECCPGWKHCGETTCIRQEECCDEDSPPACGLCEVEFCDNGSRACRDSGTKPTCGSWAHTFNCTTNRCECVGTCGDGNCCPIGEDGWHCREGHCCVETWPGEYHCLPWW